MRAPWPSPSRVSRSPYQDGTNSSESSGASSEAIRRTLSRIAHEIIERNEELDTVALVGIHTRGVPIAQRLRRLVEERSGEEPAFGQVDITFYRDDVHVRAGHAPRRAQPLVRD